MTGLKYEGGKQSRVFSAQLNSIAYCTRNGVTADCDVTESSPAAMTVDVNQGIVFFGNDIVVVAAQTGLVIAANALSNPRIDLVAIDNTGTASIIQGTAALLPLTPDYNPDTYIILAMVTVSAGATSIVDANIDDNRVLNIGGGASGGDGGVNRYKETFTSQTTIVVTHNLGDDEPLVQVYNSSGVKLEDSDITSITVNDTNTVTVVLGASTTGYIVVHGGIGGTAYYSEAFSSATTWNVAHNLARKFVSVQAYNSSDQLIEPQSVTLTDPNNLVVVFAVATVGQIVVTGGSRSTAIGVNDALIESLYSDTILNKIRQTLDRADVDSNGQDDILSEAYVNANGQNSTISAPTTTALFDTNRYVPTVVNDASSDTLANPDSFDTPSEPLSDKPVMSFLQVSAATTVSLGTTFPAKTVLRAVVRGGVSQITSGSQIAKLQTYDGATWNDHTTLFSEAAIPSGYVKRFEKIIDINASIQGIRLTWQSTSDTSWQAFCDYLTYGVAYADSIVAHDVATGFFDNDIKRSISKSMLHLTETGASLNHKLYNQTLSTANANAAEATLATLSSIVNDAGHYIRVTNRCNIDTVTKHASVTATRALIKRKGALIASATFVGNVATFDAGIELKSGDYIAADNSAAAYNQYRNTTATYPYAGTDVVFIGGGTTNNNNGPESHSTIAYNIVSMTTKAITINEDSGWKSNGTVVDFTAFSSEPSKYLVKLIPKTVSPAIDTPSIRGSGVRVFNS